MKHNTVCDTTSLQLQQVLQVQMFLFPNNSPNSMKSSAQTSAATMTSSGSPKLCHISAGNGIAEGCPPEPRGPRDTSKHLPWSLSVRSCSGPSCATKKQPGGRGQTRNLRTPSLTELDDTKPPEGHGGNNLMGGERKKEKLLPFGSFTITFFYF